MRESFTGRTKEKKKRPETWSKEWLELEKITDSKKAYSGAGTLLVTMTSVVLAGTWNTHAIAFALGERYKIRAQIEPHFRSGGHGSETCAKQLLEHQVMVVRSNFERTRWQGMSVGRNAEDQEALLGRKDMTRLKRGAYNGCTHNESKLKMEAETQTHNLNMGS